MELKEVEKFKEEFSNLVKIAKKEGFYLDINLFNKSEIRINLDKTNTDINKDCDSGIKIRLWDGEKFLEEATSSKVFSNLKNLTNKLIETAKKNQINKQELLIDKEIISKNFMKKEITDLKLEDKVSKLIKFRDDISNLSKNIVNTRTAFIEELEENIFVNEYKQLYQKIPLKIFVIVAFVNCKDAAIRTVYEAYCDNNYNVFEKAKNKFDKFKKTVDNIYNAKKLKGGKYQVILAPKLSGLLAHESFGHGMEADTMMKGRALASEWVGKKIGSENINIVDYAQVEGKNGEFNFDHEGNIAKKTYLVKNGIINEPMADIYSKTKLNLKNSCNSRFESFDHKNYNRMSNTYFEAGDENFEDLISKVKDGIFITSSGGGMEDPKGWGVQIQGNSGQRIKNGKLINEFYDGFALTGFLPTIIKNISGISKEFEMDGAGSCGKGHKEWVRVAEGGPYLLIDEVILGCRN